MKFLLFPILLITGLFVSAQTDFEDQVLGALQHKSILLEKVFIHTNKTSYFVDDTIWFKAYVGTKDNGPSYKTTKLYVNLITADGEIIFDKEVFIFQGTGRGEFELDVSVEPGRYYIVAYTNYLRNFGSDHSYIQEIQLIGQTPNQVATTKDQYDIQLLPEGGYLLEDAENTLAIKSLFNGLGTDFTGEIVGSNGELATRFQSQHLGMAKCRFFHKINERYKALIRIKDSIIEIGLPKARATGIILDLDNSKSDSLLLKVHTNRATLESDYKPQYTLLYHQRNQILGSLQLGALDSVSASIKSDKTVFFAGVNSVTLFEGLRPIAERRFYVEPQKHSAPTLKNLTIESDSLTYELTLEGLEPPNTANLSISVLPPGAQNYKQQQNIVSAFLLTPFLKGHIENPAYYFNKKNRLRNEHLDLLLLTQGWSKYNLSSLIAELNPRPVFQFEQGYEIKGSIKGNLYQNHLALLSSKDELLTKSPMNGSPSFTFDKLLLYKGDTLKLTFLDSLNNAFRPDDFLLDSTIYDVRSAHRQMTPSNLPRLSDKRHALNDSINDWYSKGTIALEEVAVAGKKRSERFLRRRKLIKKYKPMVFDIGKYFEIPLPREFNDHNNDLMSFLRFNEHVRLVNHNGIENYLQCSGTAEAALFINGRRITSHELPTVSIDMDDISGIMLQTLRRGDRIYQVFTSENYKRNIKVLAERYIATNGYDRAKKYYEPQYNFDRNSFNPWVQIDWKPALQTNTKGTVSFRVRKDSTYSEYLFAIQGFSSSGQLISEILSHQTTPMGLESMGSEKQ